MSSNIKSIRTQLGLTQAAFAESIGMTQGNVSHYETNGQTVMPDVARRIVQLVQTKGFSCSLDVVYSATPALKRTRKAKAEAN